MSSKVREKGIVVVVGQSERLAGQVRKGEVAL